MELKTLKYLSTLNDKEVIEVLTDLLIVTSYNIPDETINQVMEEEGWECEQVQLIEAIQQRYGLTYDEE